MKAGPQGPLPAFVTSHETVMNKLHKSDRHPLRYPDALSPGHLLASCPYFVPSPTLLGQTGGNNLEPGLSLLDGASFAHRILQVGFCTKARIVAVVLNRSCACCTRVCSLSASWQQDVHLMALYCPAYPALLLFPQSCAYLNSSYVSFTEQNYATLYRQHKVFFSCLHGQDVAFTRLFPVG